MVNVPTHKSIDKWGIRMMFRRTDMDLKRKGVTRHPSKVSITCQTCFAPMHISPNQGNMERSGEQYVRDFASLLIACLWQKHQK